MAATTTAAGRYEQLSTNRSMYLERARDAAHLTIPSLLPPEGFSPGQKLYLPYQSVGARGTNSLAASLLLVLMPPNAPSFRQVVDPAAADKMSADPQFKTKVEAALAKYERIIQTDIEASSDRVALFEALKHLIVAGNVLVYLPKEGMKVFHMDRYVVKRDGMGTALEIITKECVARMTLPQAIRDRLQSDTNNQDDDLSEVDVYTHVRRHSSGWTVQQEVQGIVIPGTRGQYPLDRCPWLPLRLVRIDGEDYGRGYVEEYLGDLQSLEGLSKAVVEAAAAAAKILFLVKPNGTTSMKTLVDSPNLAVRSGNAEDVTVLQVQKYADLNTARQTMTEIEKRLEYAFMLASAAQRDAERVTAEEVRMIAGELEKALGGVYSILAQEFQQPYIQRRIQIATKAGRLPQLPKGLVKTTIITGLEALGRGQDKQRLIDYVTTLSQAVGPQNLPQFINMDNFASRLAAADGIDPVGLIKTADQRAQEAAQAQQQAALQTVAPEAVKQIGGMIQKGMPDNGGQQAAGPQAGG